MNQHTVTTVTLCLILEQGLGRERFSHMVRFSLHVGPAFSRLLAQGGLPACMTCVGHTVGRNWLVGCEEASFHTMSSHQRRAVFDGIVLRNVHRMRSARPSSVTERYCARNYVFQNTRDGVDVVVGKT